MPSKFLTTCTVSTAPSSFAKQVAVCAVIAPLRFAARKEEGHVAAALTIHKHWRNRVDALYASGWTLTTPRDARSEHAPLIGGSRKLRMFNCPPLAVQCVPAGMPCGVPTICPQCWGREAINRWSVMDRALFGEQDRPAKDRKLVADVALVSRRLAVDVPLYDELGVFAMPAYLDQRIKLSPFRRTPEYMLPCRTAEFRQLKQAGALGGLEVLRFKPRYIPDPADPAVKGISGWTLEARQIIVVPTAAVDGFLAHPKVQSPHQVKARAVAAVTDRLALAKLVGWACEYTPHLLYGPLNYTKGTYTYRRTRRLATRFGSCFGLPSAAVPAASSLISTNEEE